MDTAKKLIQKCKTWLCTRGKDYICALWNKLRASFISYTKSAIGIAKLCVFAVLFICLCFICFMTRDVAKLRAEQAAQAEAALAAAEQAEAAATESVEETEEELKADSDAVVLTDFNPSGDSSRILGTLMQQNGAYIDSYSAEGDNIIDFLTPNDYSSVTGITTFRGNNFRNSAQLGTADLSERSFGDYWSFQTDDANDVNGNLLSGSGSNAQPLAVCWTKEEKENMNMFDWAKEKDELVEIIYPSLDGNIYFFDVETGSMTRSPLDIGYSFSSCGTLDPRGYPALYIGGSMTNESGTSPCIFIISLLDGQILSTIGENDIFSIHWNADFNSSPLIDAESDQLICWGENGVLYLVKLNTSYEHNILSVEPSQTIEWKYTAAETYGYGVTSSPVAWRGHLMFADRGGNFLCLDLNTLTVDWCIDSMDLTRCSPVLELDENGHPYLYISTSFHYGYRAYYQQVVPVRKIDAVNGKVMWEQDFFCYTTSDGDGGVIGTPALGTGALDGILYVSVARYPETDSGTLIAIDTETGEELWRFESAYGYSSPTCFCDSEGNGYVVYISRDEGCVYLLDGKNGCLYDQYIFNVPIESSPIVCNNFLISGSTNYYLFGIELK